MAADAGKVAAFLGSAGLATDAYAGTFDVVFNDVADRDAGVSGRWWDRYDQTLPDFKQWVRQLNGGTASGSFESHDAASFTAT